MSKETSTTKKIHDLFYLIHAIKKLDLKGKKRIIFSDFCLYFLTSHFEDIK
jgi:hypothetical protein